MTVIASGSASSESADRLSEPLTGRARTFHLPPLSWEEVPAGYRLTAPDTALEEMLRFGVYPRVHTRASGPEKEEYLYDYVNNYLYRDLPGPDRRGREAGEARDLRRGTRSKRGTHGRYSTRAGL